MHLDLNCIIGYLDDFKDPSFSRAVMLFDFNSDPKSREEQAKHY